MAKPHNGSLWMGRKRIMFFGLPWTFTIYDLTEERLFINTGFFSAREDEVRLYRITDLTLTRSLWQRIIGTGTIHVDSADKTMKNFDIVNIKESQRIKELLSDKVEEARRRNRVYARESMDVPGGPDHDGDGYPDDMDDAEDDHDGH